MIGSYREWLRQQNRNVSVDIQVGTAATGTVQVIASPRPKYVIYVQRIICYVITNAAFTATFQDSNGTPVVLAFVPASPGVGPQIFEYGDEGFPLTAGKELDVVLSGAGLALNIIVEAFARIPVGTVCVPADL